MIATYLLRQLPNALTVLRLLLVAPIAVAILSDRTPLALALFVIAGLSDVVDGFLARYYGWQSQVGGLLDPVADKLLVMVVFVCLTIAGLMPLWLTATVILRDLVIGLGAAAWRFRRGPFEAQPLVVSKLNTLILLVVVVATLLPWGDAGERAATLEGLYLLALVSLVVSGVAYVLIWSARGGGDAAGD